MHRQLLVNYQKALFLLCISIVLFACSAAEKPAIKILNGKTMGTTYSVQVIDDGTNLDYKELGEGLESNLQAINKLMSTWDPGSELSRFNQAPVGKWFRLSDETAAVLKLALAISQQTDGKFDVTLGQLVNLWGFGPGVQTMTIPNDGDIKKAMLRTGMQHIFIRPDTNHVKKDRNIYIDFSAIAKGYAVDRLADYLSGHGIKNYLIEIGGELRAQGHKPGGRNWKIGIESPQFTGRVVQHAVKVNSAAMATSGDYRNYFEKNGHRYSHMLDPGTGRPITHQLASVTVIHESTATADALATALMVMGPEKAQQFTEAHAIAAFFIIRQGDGFAEQYSSSFARFIE
ncbi:FAD:protein FMN transferase [Sulfuriflexus sp.]|uniref:FAD:protein FMN transferase n=1 Tax=Sulfuriflexus sp. TaxID=2015443 RepID=UPI0028CF8D91|nr:FAD:protein FMN transferase [Sulfuriflexus sp.]MDT8404527.1 FAD:protein FMN transferase [Sulfuriflexus sp.]